MQAAHWIRGLRFEVAAPDHGAFDSMRAALRLRLEGLVLPRLQAALDGAGREGEVIRFGRIEVDLGAMTPEEAGSDLLAQRIGDGLAAALRGARGSAVAGEPAAGPLPAQADAGAMLKAFLLAGILPWPAPGRALEALAAALEALGESEFGALAERLRPALARPRAAERLVRQFSAAIVARFVSAFARGAGVQAADFHVSGENVAAAAALVAAAAKGEPLRMRPKRGAPGASRRSTPRTAGAAEREEKEGDEPVAAEPGETSFTETADAERSLPADGSAPLILPVAAAGLVLLHPFLRVFFQRLHLVGKDDAFLGAEERRRAVLLAHSLATGAEEADEPDVAVAKLLCGVDFAEPVPRRLDSTDDERLQADSLLAAAIGHWPQLGGTSISGLREAFLLRPGRLERQEEGWRLTVERLSLDVLLDSLPWTISLVRTPFMAEILRVNWR
jgi:hypothetical protein